MFNLLARTSRVVVAVVFDPRREKFLVVFNPRWRGYTFPMRRFRQAGGSDPLFEREKAEEEARAALEADLGPELGATREAHWMDRIEVLGVSGRTSRKVRYVYDIVSVVPAGPLPDGPFAGRFGFLSADEIRDSDPDEPGPLARVVTWTTWQVLTKLLDNQEAAVGVVCRSSAGRREYLMTHNRLGHWFFPSRRMGDLVPPFRLLVNDFRDANYLGHIDPGAEASVELEQTTAHLGSRHYRFHLCALHFRDEDLGSADNRLEVALRRAGTAVRWVSEADLETPAESISPTVAGLSAALKGLGCP